ncbi:hypothetical protein, partial [Listeria monocytogenes]|uniref:hypothetical protein n=1 Tax=Listeria monocytogenes TaxID=1639 RepID=UPI002FDBF717
GGGRAFNVLVCGVDGATRVLTFHHAVVGRELRACVGRSEVRTDARRKCSGRGGGRDGVLSSSHQ